MKKTTRILFLACVIFITGCTTSTDELADLSQAQTNQDATPKFDALACKKEGGTVKKVCMLGVPFCIHDYLDGGKKCNDSSECEGECRIEKKFVKAGSQTSGFCSANNTPCGCFQSIKKGVAQPALCVD